MPRAARLQPDLFPPPPPPPSYPERARTRLNIWLAELEAAVDGRWAADKADARAKLLPDLASWLPDDEGKGLAERIARELERVRAG